MIIPFSTLMKSNLESHTVGSPPKRHSFLPFLLNNLNMVVDLEQVWEFLQCEQADPE